MWNIFRKKKKEIKEVNSLNADKEGILVMPAVFVDWIYILNNKIEELESIGKYIFFSDNREKLIEIGRKVLIDFNLSTAKVLEKKTENAKEGFGYVLCIYDISPRFKKELVKYADFREVHYRYWKNNEETREGKYSEEYKKAKGLS